MQDGANDLNGMELETLRDETLHHRRPFLRLLFEAAADLGGRVEMETQFGHLGQFVSAQGDRCPIFGNAVSLNTDAAAAISADKDYTARLLAHKGLKTPRGQLVTSASFAQKLRLKDARAARNLPTLEDGIAFAQQSGFPVFSKPNRGSEGFGIRSALNVADLKADLEALLTSETHCLVQEAIPGRDYRVVILDGQVVLAYERRPFSVTGNGKDTLAALCDVALENLSRAHRGTKLDRDDPRMSRHLAAQELGWDQVPSEGQMIALLPSANLSTGGSLIDVTNDLPEEAHWLAHAAAAHIGLALAGVDILSPDLTQGVDDAIILEVNSAPGLDGYASAGPLEWDRARDIVIAMLDR